MCDSITSSKSAAKVEPAKRISNAPPKRWTAADGVEVILLLATVLLIESIRCDDVVDENSSVMCDVHCKNFKIKELVSFV